MFSQQDFSFLNNKTVLYEEHFQTIGAGIKLVVQAHTVPDCSWIFLKFVNALYVNRGKDGVNDWNYEYRIFALCCCSLNEPTPPFFFAYPFLQIHADVEIAYTDDKSSSWMIQSWWLLLNPFKSFQGAYIVRFLSREGSKHCSPKWNLQKRLVCFLLWNQAFLVYTAGYLCQIDRSKWLRGAVFDVKECW